MMSGDYDHDYYDQFIYGDAGKSNMTASESERYYADQNARLAAMPDPYEEPTQRPHRRSRTPRFSEWYRMPENKRPPEVEGKNKRIYNITGMWRREFIDGLGSHVQQLQAIINDRHVIVSQYDDGSYVVGDEKHAYKATGDTLDDVIDGIVS